MYDKPEGKIRSARQDGLPLSILGGNKRIDIVVVCSQTGSAHRHRLPTRLSQPRLRCCPLDSPSRLPPLDSIVNRSFSPPFRSHSGICLPAFPAHRALVHVTSLPILASPHSIYRCENLYTTPPFPASPHSIHHTVKNPTIDSYGHNNKDHSKFPGRQTRPTNPHHLTMVVVRYRVLYHQLPLIASLPFLFVLNRIGDGPFTFSVMI